MTTIGLTGAAGMIGWHARCVLRARGITAKLAFRSTFENDDELDAFAQGCDAILHIAGMNRGEESEIEAVNEWLAETLSASCDRVDAIPHIVYFDSTHRNRDNAYGRSKAAAADHLGRWTEGVGARFTDLVLPHVFGEGGRPFYNSVVSTFCHQIAVDEVPTIDNDGQLELVHAQDAVAQALAAIEGNQEGEHRVVGTPITVSQLLEELSSLDEAYTATQFPDLRDRFRLRLFNVLRSYRFPHQYPTTIPAHADARGSFFEVAKSSSEGQISFSTTRSGITRGDHFHLHKVERFLVVSGQAVIRLRRMFSDEVVEFMVDGDEPVAIDMPTLYTHSITNVGEDDLFTLFWINEIFDEADPDTFAEPVLLVPR